MALLGVWGCAVSFAQNVRPRVGLVLSGGGAKGLAHIGVLKVIDELGIPIDYIGGTSMGSVVGGLYAMGYSAAEIEEMTLEQDWVALLTDQLERQNLSVYEKEDYDKFLISFPFDSLKIKLPSGLGAGQNISMMLSKMALPLAGEEDFNNFPKPFLCVAVDIVSGDEVVLRQGYLPDAIRASMAIPTIFTPVEIGDYYLVDGGLKNNFPVDHVKAMGADIIIGVNLGLKEYTREDLRSLPTVLEQSLFFQAKEKNRQNQRMCDVLLLPDVYSSNATSFSNTADLIAIGEDVARANIELLKPLANKPLFDELNAQTVNYGVVDTLVVRDISFEGLNYVSEDFMDGKLRLKVPGKVAVDDLENGIDRAYGTLFFNKITYLTEYDKGDTVRLVLRVEEKSNDLVRLGGRYDSYFKAQLLLNATFRNKMIKGSKLTLDVLLGIYPSFEGEYRVNTGWKESKNAFLSRNGGLGILPDFGLRGSYRTAALNHFEESDLIATYNYQYFATGGFISTSVSNPLYLEAGLEYDFSFLESTLVSSDEQVENQSLVGYGKVVYDSYDNQVVPKQGAYMVLWGDVVRDYNIPTVTWGSFYRGGAQLEKIFKLHRSIHVTPYLKVGVVLGDTIPPLHKMYLGGNLLRTQGAQNIYSFSGLRLMELNNNCLYAGGVKLRFNPYKRHYLTFDNTIGRLASNPYRLYTSFDEYVYGFGAIYSVMSMAGPLEVGVYKSNQALPWLMFMSFGYWF